MKRCLTSFNIQEIKIKITLRHIYTPIRIKTFLSLTVLCDDQNNQNNQNNQNAPLLQVAMQNRVATVEELGSFS